jgi:hypothetical protein
MFAFTCQGRVLSDAKGVFQAEIYQAETTDYSLRARQEHGRSLVLNVKIQKLREAI